MKKPYKVLGAVAGAAAVICAGIGLWQYVQERSAGSEYEEIRKDAAAEQEKEAEAQEPAVEIPIDFDSLTEQNPDIYAWITVPGTQIDYPVLQRTGDNSYYLDHTAENKESPEGAIYTEDYNSKDFEDPNTVIYGHDMKNGSMFQNLLNYQDKEFFDNNREVLVYTPDAIRHYRIFAAYLYDDRHIMQSFDFDIRSVYSAYLDHIFSIRDMNARIDTSMEVGADDKIITLSTCYGSQSDRRYLVQAVLVSIEE